MTQTYPAFEVERELKNLLSAGDFLKLCNYYQVKPEEAKPQTNHYFDTAGYELSDQKAMLRAREKDGRWQLTLKEPGERGAKNETHHLLPEEERELLFGIGIIPAGNVYDAVRRFTQNPFVEYKGQLETGRIIIPIEYGEIMLDKSTYGTVVDYEVELEVKEGKSMKEAEIYLSLALRNLSINRLTPKSKFQRFLKEKKRMGN